MYDSVYPILFDWVMILSDFNVEIGGHSVDTRGNPEWSDPAVT